MNEKKPKCNPHDACLGDSPRRDEHFRVALLYAALVVLFLIGFFLNNLEYESY